MQVDLRSVELIKASPPTEKAKKSCSKYAFDLLEPGFAFIFPSEYSMPLLRKYSAAAHSYGRRTGKKFAIRKEQGDHGFEIWCYRVA